VIDTRQDHKFCRGICRISTQEILQQNWRDNFVFIPHYVYLRQAKQFLPNRKRIERTRQRGYSMMRRPCRMIQRCGDSNQFAHIITPCSNQGSQHATA